MFEPSSTDLVWVLWVVAVLGIVAVALVWPKLAGRGVAVLLGRLGTQLGASALVVLAVAATLNQQNGWYGDWPDLVHDLTGSSPAVQHVALKGQLQVAQRYNAHEAVESDVRAQHAFGAQRAAFQRATKLRTGLSPQGQYVRVVVPGLGAAARRGRTVGEVLIWLPPSYVDGASQATYPVIEAFHGQPGGPDDYSKRLKLQNMLVRAHQRVGLVEPVVVIPDFLPSGIDTECTDSPGIAMEIWLTKTVPEWVVRHLRVRPDKESWATLGFSAGGFCAEVSTFLHPQTFGSAMLFGTYDWPDWSNWLPYKRHNAWPARYNMLSVLKDRPPPVDVWVEVSGGDRFSSPPSQALIKYAHAPTSVTAVYLRDAGHRFSVWQAAMPRALDWLARSEPGFEPGMNRATSRDPRHPAHSSDEVLPSARESSHPVRHTPGRSRNDARGSA